MFKPMLAGKAPAFDQIKYPVLATPKIDGIRCCIIADKAMSRSMKPIPNRYVRETLEKYSSYLNRFDGELVLFGKHSFNDVSSAIMSHTGAPNFIYRIFDFIDTVDKMPYWERYQLYNKPGLPYFCVPLINRRIESAKELEEYETQCLTEGYEGVMIRDPNGPYKQGRSTTKEGYLLKIKRFEDSEAEVIGVEELMHNENPAFTGELGQTKRSSCQAFQTPGGVMGALVVRDLKTGVVFNIGTGFSAADREKEWPIGIIVKYKYQKHGVVEKPRSPVFLGVRSKDDM